MVEYKKNMSSGIAKAGLATAIGAAVVALGGGNLLGGGVLNGATPANAFVSEKEMTLIRENYHQTSTIAKLESEKYTDSCVVRALAPVYGELKEQNKEICDLKAGLAMETERRACGDERLLTYVNGNFIPAEKNLNSRHINYHGCKPVIEPCNPCCCCSTQPQI